MKKLFGYVRVSTLKQGDGVSLDAQREAIEEYAARNDIQVIQWFVEKETAAKKGRPIFNNMIRDLKCGKADGLVIHKIDRSARNFADWAKIGDLADAGYQIEFVTESLDFQSRGGRLTADIQAVIAADYIRNLREECIKGMNGRLKQGLYPFCAPLGYLNNGGGKPKTIDPIRGPLVKRMFQLYASGNHSFWSLVPEMERIGLMSRGGKPVSRTFIEKTLNNPFYTGIIKIRTTGEVFQGIHDPLISNHLFESVQNVRAGKDNKKSTKHRYTYRGLFRCGNCFSTMTAELQKEHIYYRCHKKNCSTKTIREECLEEAIFEILKRCRFTDKGVERLREGFQTWIKENDATSLLDRAPLELVKLDARLDRLTDKLLDEIIGNDIFQKKKTQILKEKSRWHDILKSSSDMAVRLQKLEKFLEHVKSLYSNYLSTNSDRKREILNFLTSNRIVSGRNVELEPQNWLQTLENMLIVYSGAPPRDSLRTFLQNPKIEEVLNEICEIEI